LLNKALFLTDYLLNNSLHLSLVLNVILEYFLICILKKYYLSLGNIYIIMYLWKTKNLAIDIKNQSINEKDKMFYYLFTMLFYNITSYLYLIDIEEYTTNVIFLEIVSITLIWTIGTLITFSTNKGNNGIDYISRVIMLSVPITIRLLLVALIFELLIFSMITYVWDYDILTEWLTTGLSTIIMIAIFWRINVHLKYINQ